ncbi:peptidoglycan editing factor PgeF [bacterium]|nr:peptidoglycan editing factor PgeF [bacterium]
MFYFEDFHGTKILKSDLLEEITAFFSTRELPDLTKLGTGRILSPNQTHSDNVEFVDERNEYPNTDGLILQNTNDAVYLRFADCTPLIFYDTVQKIAAVSHAGWRGTAQKIGVKTIEKMQSYPKDIIALIGPAISMCCYEVSEEVRDTLLATVQETEGLFINRNVDLKRINAQQLKEIGVRQIDICPYCTSCDNDLFYSYRKENGTDKRHIAVAKLS